MNFHTLADHIPQHVWMANADGEIFWHNRQWHDYTGLGEEEARGLVWGAITHEAHRERVVNGYLASIRSGEPWHDSFLLRRHDGEWRWFLAQAAPVRNRNGVVTRWFGTNTDITEQKESEERHKQLMREVDHRAKNALAVAQAVVTLTSASNIDEYRKLVESRIAALSRAHMLLADHRWQGVELRSIINGELGARAGMTGQIRMSGETVKIKPSSGQSLALLFNELIANAERHGALTSESGELHIEWKETDDGMICIRWSEQGLEGVLLPETRGFGFSVLQRIIKQQLGGSFDSTWRSHGVTHSIRLPGAARTVDVSASAPPVAEAAQ